MCTPDNNWIFSELVRDASPHPMGHKLYAWNFFNFFSVSVVYNCTNTIIPCCQLHYLMCQWLQWVLLWLWNGVMTFASRLAESYALSMGSVWFFVGFLHTAFGWKYSYSIDNSFKYSENPFSQYSENIKLLFSFFPETPEACRRVNANWPKLVRHRPRLSKTETILSTSQRKANFCSSRVAASERN